MPSFIHRIRRLLVCSPVALIRNLGWLTLAVIPAVWIAVMLKRYLINSPFMDDFVWLPLYEKMHRGTLSWHDYFFVQMEHRLTVPCYLAWLCAKLKPGHISWHCWIAFGQIVLTTGNLGWLVKRFGRVCVAPLAVLVAWIFFSPLQYTTLLWGDCFSSFLPATFLTTALVLLHTRLHQVVKFGVVVACAILGTHSFASGVLIWMLVPPLVWCSTCVLPDRRARLRFLGAWLLAFVVTMVAYCHNLVNQAEPIFSYEQGKQETLATHLSALIHDPGDAIKFVVMFAGALLGRGSFADLMPAALACGIVLCAVLLAGAVVCWRRRADEPLRNALLLWVVLGSYTVATGMMVAVGRFWASSNLHGALWGRYTTHAAPLTFAAFAVLAILVGELARGTSVLALRGRLMLTLVIGSLLTCLAYGWAFGVRQMGAWYSSRVRDAASTLFYKCVPGYNIQGPITGNADMALRWDNLGLLNPAMLPTPNLDHFAVHATGLSLRNADLDEFRSSGGYKVNVSGFALLNRMERVADAVLLTYKNEADERIIFAVAQVNQLPLYLNHILDIDSQYLHKPYHYYNHIYGGFSMEADFPKLPRGHYELNAWALDYRKQAVWKINGKFWANIGPRGLQVSHDDN